MNTSKLYIEYVRVIELCKGTALEDAPWKCVRKLSPGFMFYSKHPVFDGSETHEFAVAILEDKPVFYGDEVYDKMFGIKMIIRPFNIYPFLYLESTHNGGSAAACDLLTCSWQPTKPKRMFKLNGVTLPCPLPEGTDMSGTKFFCVSVGCNEQQTTDYYYYNNREDASFVKQEISNILREARNE